MPLKAAVGRGLENSWVIALKDSTEWAKNVPLLQPGQGSIRFKTGPGVFKTALERPSPPFAEIMVGE